MEIVRNRSSIFAFAITALVFWGLRFIHNHWWLASDNRIQSGFVYEMPRVQSSPGNYDLDGRELDREILENPSLGPKASKPAQSNKISKVQSPLKKSAEDATSSKPKSQSLKVEVTDSSRNPRMTGLSRGQGEAANPAVGPGAFGPMGTANKPAATGAQETVTTQSIQEWRSTLMNSPTATEAAAFVKAHDEGQINDHDFYGLTFELLSSGNNSYQQLATLILNQDSAVNQFSYLAQEFNSGSSTVRSLVNPFLQACDQPGKFATLNAGLRSSISGVVPMALQVLGTAVQNTQTSIQQGGATARGVAGTGATGAQSVAQPSAFQMFLPNLNLIVKNDAADASAAQTLISEIQAFATAH